MSPPQETWPDLIARDPGHSARYAERFRLLAAQGRDLHGEARLIDAMVGRGAAILDAGCGPGRHTGYLHAAGHRVVGVDIDPTLLAVAEAEAPGPLYVLGDLVDYALPDTAPSVFDAILSAGNVVTFLHPDARVRALEGFASRLAPEGRAVVGLRRRARVPVRRVRRGRGEPPGWRCRPASRPGTCVRSLRRLSSSSRCCPSPTDDRSDAVGRLLALLPQMLATVTTRIATDSHTRYCP